MSDGTWEIPGGETVRKATQIERVLRDLIAELRDEWETFTARDWNRAWYGCALAEATDRAEQRLREVSGE